MDEPKPPRVMWNLSSTRIGGDIAGAIAVVGSVVALLAGVPPFKYFLAGALVCGAFCAFGLSIWHRRHLTSRTPPNTIEPR